MNPAIWLLVGGAFGWLVSLRMQRSNSRTAMVSILAGVFGALIGAVVGGILVTPAFGLATIDKASFSMLSLGHSFLGSGMLLFLVGGFSPGHPGSGHR